MHSFLGGPPCCTLSKARAADNPVEDRASPRPVRSADELWGLPSLALRKQYQVIEGNVLLGSSLQALGELALPRRAGILEHPAEPDQPTAPSIWKPPIVQLLLGLPGMTRLSLSQGLLGADRRKPTEVMALNLPTLPAAIVRWRLTPDVPRNVNIGRDAHGHFRTAHLKEHSPAFCGALAQATFEAQEQSPYRFALILQCCVAMQQAIHFGFIGPDYAQR